MNVKLAFNLFTLGSALIIGSCQASDDVAAPPIDYLERAFELADNEAHGYLGLCSYLAKDRVPKTLSISERKALTPPAPAKVFDNLYFLGNHWTNAWAITTPDGIIVLDAMDNAYDAEYIIADGLKSLGLNPADIKYVIVSHGHGDHYGGTNYLKEKYGTRIVMSNKDWSYIENPKTEFPAHWVGLQPKRDMSVNDGDLISLGGVDVEIFATPGHTMGTISSIFNVKSNGVTYRAMLWGGSSFRGGQDRPDMMAAHVSSAKRGKEKVKEQNISVLLSNHPGYVRTMKKLTQIESGTPVSQVFVQSEEALLQTLEVIESCALATQSAWKK